MGKTEDFYLGVGLCLYARSLGPVFIPIYHNLELPPDFYTHPFALIRVMFISH